MMNLTQRSCHSKVGALFWFWSFILYNQRMQSCQPLVPGMGDFRAWTGKSIGVERMSVKERTGQRSVSGSVVSSTFQPHGLYPVRLLCPWDSAVKNTGVGNYSLLQGIFPSQESNLGLHTAGRFFAIWATRGAREGCYAKSSHSEFWKALEYQDDPGISFLLDRCLKSKNESKSSNNTSNHLFFLISSIF